MKKPIDRHQSRFMVRLPEEFRTALQEVQRRTRRTITEEVRIALEAHLESQGVSLPESTRK